jgi:hypothetical protein
MAVLIQKHQKSLGIEAMTSLGKVVVSSMF